MSEKLSPCPFCGCDDASVGTAGEEPFVNCPECMASTDQLCGICETDEEAIAAWNRRSLSAAVEVVREAASAHYDELLASHSEYHTVFIQTARLDFIGKLDALTSTESEDA